MLQLYDNEGVEYFRFDGNNLYIKQPSKTYIASDCISIAGLALANKILAEPSGKKSLSYRF